MAENHIKSAEVFGYTGSLINTVQCIPGASFLHGIYQTQNSAASCISIDSVCYYVSAGNRISFTVPLPFCSVSGSQPFLLIYS